MLPELMMQPLMVREGLKVTVSVNGSTGVSNVTAIVSGGTGFEVGDSVTIVGGNGDSTFEITNITNSTGYINYNTKTINVYVPDNIDLSQIVASFS
jgi:hypothetical protein